MRILDMSEAGLQAKVIKEYLVNYSQQEECDQVTALIYSWSNGRERGYVVRYVLHDPIVDRRYNKATSLVVVFGECRSSDNLFVDRWIEKNNPLEEGLTPDNPSYDKAYQERADFQWGRVDQVVDYIHSEITKWLEYTSEPVTDPGSGTHVSECSSEA